MTVIIDNWKKKKIKERITNSNTPRESVSLRNSYKYFKVSILIIYAIIQIPIFIVYIRSVDMTSSYFLFPFFVMQMTWTAPSAIPRPSLMKPIPSNQLSARK